MAYIPPIRAEVAAHFTPRRSADREALVQSLSSLNVDYLAGRLPEDDYRRAANSINDQIAVYDAEAAASAEMTRDHRIVVTYKDAGQPADVRVSVSDVDDLRTAGTLFGTLAAREDVDEVLWQHRSRRTGRPLFHSVSSVIHTTLPL